MTAGWIAGLGVAALHLAGGAFAQPATPAADSPAVAAPPAAQPAPRTISDITALLDQYQPDPSRIERLRRMAAEPAGAAEEGNQGRFYARRAWAAAELGMIEQEIADLRRALELLQDDPDGAWGVGRRLFSAELYAGNFVNARELKERMQRMHGWNRRRGRDVRDLAGLANLYLASDDVSEAHAQLRQAEAVLFKMRRLGGDPRADLLVFDLECVRGQVFDTEGKLTAGETAYRKGLDAVARFTRAMESMTTESDSRRKRGMQQDTLFWRDRCETALAENLMAQGRLAEAEVAIRNVLKSNLSRTGRTSVSTGLSMVSFSRVLMERGRSSEAAALAATAVDDFERIGVASGSLGLIRARGTLGAALAAQSHWPQALEVFRNMQSELARDSRLLGKLGPAGVDWALALIKTGHAEQAVPLLEAALRTARQRLGRDHYQVAEQRGLLALALAGSGQSQRAFAELGEAVQQLLSQVHAGADDESGSGARARRLAFIFEGYIKLLYEMRDRKPGPGAGFDPAAEAFRLVDAVRGGSTWRALTAAAARASAGTPELAALVRREQDAKQQIAAFYSTLLKLLNAPADQQLPQVVAQMRSRIQELEKEQRQLFGELERRFPAYVNLVNPQPATVEQTRKALREGEALVSVLATEDRTFVWVVPKQGAIGFHASGLGERALNRAVGQLRRALDPGDAPLERFPEFDVAGAHRLYAELLKPVEGAWKGAHTLMVVSNGALSQLPFSLLPTAPTTLAVEQGLRFERYRQVAWLIKEAAVVQLPAVNTLVTLRALPPASAARGAFIGFGDPQFGATAPAAAAQPVVLRMRGAALPRELETRAPADWTPYSQLSPLPDTREEILSIARTLKADPRTDVFLGAQASKENVKKSDLRSRRIVAFATHGLIPGDFPNLEEPALALSAPDGNAETGLLTLGDILGLKMDADWVVLSACNTAAGDGAGAEAISGLGRGFFYAGSRALLVTHWPVETRSARELVTGLFERYAAQSVSRAEALRQASLAVMQQTAQDGSGTALFSYAHPLFWAPYALVGDGGR